MSCRQFNGLQQSVFTCVAESTVSRTGDLQGLDYFLEELEVGLEARWEPLAVNEKL